MPPDQQLPPLREKDAQLAETIVLNPTASFKRLAELTQIPESTISKRLSFFLRQRYLERSIRVVNWHAMGYPFRHRIDIVVDQRQLTLGQGGRMKPAGKQKTKSNDDEIRNQEELAVYIKHDLAKKYEGRLIVLSVGILLGHDADLSMTVCSRSPDDIRQFVTSDLRALGGVMRTSTSEEVWTCPESITDLEPAIANEEDTTLP